MSEQAGPGRGRFLDGAGLFDGFGLSLAPVAAFLDRGHHEYRKRVRAFCEQRLAGNPDPECDGDARLRARELVRLMGEARLYRPVEREDVRGCLVAREMLAWWSPLADAVFAIQALSATPGQVVREDAGRDAPSGPDATDGPEGVDPPRAWMARALEGQAMGAFAMTERDAGSDVASMSTTAVRDGPGYRISGTKSFISNAGIADFYVVFARTPAEETAISCFVVPADQKGVEFAREMVMSAPHPLGEVRFADCYVPAAARLGREGAGFRVGMATLDRLRPTVAAAASGMAGRALHECVQHARERHQFGRPLGSFQLVRQQLAVSAMDLTAARLLAYRAAWEKDRGAPRITVEAAMAKAFATETAQRVVDRAVQVLGGRGVLADHPVDRLYRSVRALRIYEGTTEIQYLIIGSAIVKNPDGTGGGPGSQTASEGAS